MKNKKSRNKYIEQAVFKIRENFFHDFEEEKQKWRLKTEVLLYDKLVSKFSWNRSKIRHEIKSMLWIWISFVPIPYYTSCKCIWRAFLLREFTFRSFFAFVSIGTKKRDVAITFGFSTCSLHNVHLHGSITYNRSSDWHPGYRISYYQTIILSNRVVYFWKLVKFIYIVGGWYLTLYSNSI